MFQAIVIDAAGHLSVREEDGAKTRLACPFSKGPCGFHCPLCTRPERNPDGWRGYHIDLYCAATVRRISAMKVEKQIN